MKKSARKRPPVRALISKINSLDSHEQQELAKQCGTSIGNLRQIAYGFGGVSPALAKSIIQNAKCDISVEHLIPELFT